jgi:hypothetical protein
MGMGKEERKVQMFTAEQVEGLRSYLAQKGIEPPPQPETFMMGGIARAVYLELKKLRENGYSLKVLARVFEKNGIVITTNALSTYLSKQAPTREQTYPTTARKGSSAASLIAEGRHGQFQMKADVPLQERWLVWNE